MMDLTDEDLMLLEQLTYLDDSVYEAAGVKKPDFDKVHSVDQLLSDFCEADENGITGLDNLDAKGTIYKDGSTTFVQGYELAAVIREIHDKENLIKLGISEIKPSVVPDKRDAIVFCDVENQSSKEAIVCFRGDT